MQNIYSRIRNKIRTQRRSEQKWYRFDLVPDEVPESVARTTKTKTFILQAHRDSKPQEMLEKLQALWADGLKPMQQDDEPPPTLEEVCKEYGWSYSDLMKQVDEVSNRI